EAGYSPAVIQRTKMVPAKFSCCPKNRLTTIVVFLIFLSSAAVSLAAEGAPSLSLPRRSGAKPRNVVLIVTDDHRYDAAGFAGHPFLKTPHLDALAREGAHLRNALVTTSLCSPSRASI